MDVKDIPTDYDPQKQILLVAEMPRVHYTNQRSEVYTKKLDKALKENFPYKYEIVSMDDIKNKDKYSDLSIYKYALLNGNSSLGGQYYNARTAERSASTTYFDFRFYDRSNNTNYPYLENKTPYLNWAVRALTDLVSEARKQFASK
jgi:hypothetical protein